MNERGGIYALGYPVISAFGHLINLAELAFLALVLFALLIVGRDRVQHVRVADAGQRAGAAARNPVELLPQAVPGICRRIRRAGHHPGACHARVLRERADRRHRRGGRPDGDRRATPGRRLRGAAAARPRRAGRARRRHHGARQPGHRRGRQPVRWRAAPGDERARSLRVATAVDANASRGVPAARARARADVCWRAGGRGDRAMPSPRRRSVPRAAKESSRCPSR